MRLFTLLFIAGFSLTSFAKDSTFIQQDWQLALKTAKETGKPIMVDFYTDWCGWCKVMDKKTFSVPEMDARLKNEFVAIKIDAENGEGIDVAMKYRINAFPTIAFFTSEGKLMNKTMGYVQLEDFGPLLDSMVELNIPGKTYFLGISDNQNPEFPDFYLNAFAKNGEKTFPEAEEVSTWLTDNRNNWDNEVYWSVIYRFSWLLNEEQIDFYLENKDDYTRLFGSQDAESVSDGIIGSKLRKATKAKDKEAFDQLIASLGRYFEPERAKTAAMYLSLNFYQSTENYPKMVEIIESAVANDEISIDGLNNYAWDLYEKCEDQACLKKALKWMKKVVEEEPSYMYTDTYAALAYKTKNYKLAKEWAINSIDIGKKNGDDVKSTEELLKKIEKALKG